MSTITQRVYNDNYRLEIYQGDNKNITIGVYNDFYRTDAKNLTGKTLWIKTEDFTKQGTVYGDNNNLVLFILTETETNQSIGNYTYEIYMVDEDGDRETITQDILEIINIL